MEARREGCERLKARWPIVRVICHAAYESMGFDIQVYIYIYTRGFAPIGRLSMVIGPWYSRAPYVKEYEASGGRKRGNLSVHPLRGVFPPGSKDSRRWKHTFHWRENAAATCRLSMLLRAFLSLFSLEGRIGRGGSRLNRGQR